MQKVTAHVPRHRPLVVVAWIALTVVGGLFVGKVSSGLSHSLATPGLPGYDANQALIRATGLDGGEAPVIAVLHLPPGQSMRSAAGQTLAARTFAAPTQVGHFGLIDDGTPHGPAARLSAGRRWSARYAARGIGATARRVCPALRA
jgi:RND superfamily putative drug exporter